MTKPIVHVGITGAEGHLGTTLRAGLPDKFQLKAFTLTPQDFPSTTADLADADQVKGLFEGLEAVIHLAADTATTASWESVVKNNMSATYNVFEEARRAGVRRIVFASTNHTQHGDTMKSSPRDLEPGKHIMLRLNDPPNPDSLYAVSKLLGENLGRHYLTFFGIEFVALRIGATFAADDPTKQPAREDFMRAMFLSKRDCVQAFTRTLEVETNYLIAYAISNNTRRVFDLRETQAKLGFFPKDNAEDYY
jgi:nucleoside-diphosphate-sugar epimerase